MIVFDLGCENDHRFEGWFTSSDDFERQQKDTLLSCPICGSLHITRLLTAARLNSGRAEPPAGNSDQAGDKAAQYANFDAARMLKLISHIVENTEDVGRAFPEEARKIHYKESPERHIRGTASPKEVDALRDEGIDVVALPVPAHLASKPH
ncbi:MAG: DUF1178 family protein [Betaproteobacteria bacterium]|nr:MAG: DUF1178 family protein [Betaproteobacteria bacterium]